MGIIVRKVLQWGGGASSQVHPGSYTYDRFVNLQDYILMENNSLYTFIVLILCRLQLWIFPWSLNLSDIPSNSSPLLSADNAGHLVPVHAPEKNQNYAL